MTWTKLDVARSGSRQCRRAFLALVVSLGALAIAGGSEAAADARTDTLRLLVRAKSAIETGLTAQEFANVVRQLDEQIQMARLTNSQELTPRQLEVAAATVGHLKGVGALWTYLNQASTCRDRYGFYDVVQDRSCKTRLLERLSEAGLKLADVSSSEDTIHPQQVIQEALQSAYKRVSSAIEIFAAR